MDADATWDAYYRRLKERRLLEAEVLWSQMEVAGVTVETQLALDFSLFSVEQRNANSLATQLAESYTVEVTQDATNEYWFVKGTTRPYGIMLEKERHTTWVEFMADVAKSHSCVFSNWNLEAPKLNKSFSSEEIELDTE